MTYNLTLLLFGVGLLAGAILPRFLRRTPVSMPMLYLGGGMLLPFLWADIPHIDPIEDGTLIERLSEMAVIISLMGAGLKLDRPLNWRSWASIWRLLAGWRYRRGAIPSHFKAALLMFTDKKLDYRGKRWV